MQVIRCERGRLDAPEKMPQGFLRAPAHITRAGVLTYFNADGSQRREWRPLGEVMRADSLQTLISAPVCMLHPPEMVNADNREKYDRGNVGDNIVRDGGKVAASLYVKDSRLIAAVERGDMREVSAGYVCKLDATPGVVPDGEPDAGQKYDAVQRGIVYNHVAIVPMGRAGSEVRLRLDADDNAIFDPRADAEWSTAYIDDLPDSSFLYIEADGKKDESGKTTPRALRHFPVRDANGKLDMPHLRNAASRIPQSSLPVSTRERLAVEAHRLLEGATGQRNDTENSMKIEIIGGVEYEIGSAAHKDAVARRDAAEKARKDADDAKQARLDKAEADLKELQKKLDELPAELEAKAKARDALVDKARGVLGAEFKFDGLDDGAIRLEVAKKANPALVEQKKLDEKSPDAYVQALFDAAIESGGERCDEDDVAEQRRAARGDVSGKEGPAKRGDAVDAYARAIEESEAASRDLWRRNEA